MTFTSLNRCLFSGVLCLGLTTVAPAQPALEQKAVASAAELSIAFRHAARESLPGVVSITAVTEARQIEESDLSPLGEEFFRQFGGGQMQQFRRRMPAQQGQGSGFVIDASGIIMTNSHVVEDADKVIVHFQDGTELEAESWKADPWSDVAIVRVKSEQPLKAIAMGDSDALEIGDWVLALGDPFGVGTSVTAGIISGKGRAPHINQREDFLQTDAAINPGNSGGPLVNLQGEVVGMNTAISTRSGGYDGVGFAVPIHLARWVADQLIQKGSVARPYLGVSTQSLTQDLRRNLGVSDGQGAVVVQVMADSPSQKAGLRPGDVILQVDGQSVLNSVALQGVVERLQIGKSYPITVLREGEREVIQVQMEQMPERFTLGLAADEEPSPQRRRRPVAPSAVSEALGIEVTELTNDLRESLGVEDEVQGVVVTSVDDGGPAAEKGVTRGVIIERVGTTPVASVDEFNAAVSKASGGNGLLLLLRQGENTRFAVVTPRE